MGDLATISGTALVPGVSRNQRFYSPELIGRAVDRATARIDAGAMPLTMMVSHPVDEPRQPVTKIVGRITRLWQEADGRARFEASVADTPEARTVLGLIDNRDGQEPYVRGVSIRGAWIGNPRKVRTADGLAETADDMEIDGLDFTHRPGVPGAAVEQVTAPAAAAQESATGRALIIESVQEALVTAIDEADAPAQAANTPGKVFADPGYQKDGKKRYQLDTKANAKAAWSYINQKDNASAYTAPQLKRIRQRIIKALKKFGVDVDVKEGWTVERAEQVTEAAAEPGTVTEYGLGLDRGSFSVCLDNGMVTVTVCSYCVDPADLDIVARQAMAGACAAMATIDPDDDGDIDVPGESGAANVPQASIATMAPRVEAADQAAAVTESEESEVDEPGADPEPVAPPAPEPAADPTTEQEEPAVSEPTTTEAVAPSPAAAAPTITFTPEQFDAFLNRIAPPAPALAGAAAEAAPATPAPVAETAPAAPAAAPAPAEPAAAAPAAITEAEIERIVNERVNAKITEAIQSQVSQAGPPTRKGLVGRVTESGQVQTAADAAAGELNEHGLPANWPNKPLHQYNADERAKYVSAAMMQHVIGNRV